jgi:hypothetical protein
MPRLQTYFTAGLTALALLAAATTAPAQQTPQLPHAPGQGEPSTVPATPAPLPEPSLLTAPSPGVPSPGAPSPGASPSGASPPPGSPAPGSSAAPAPAGVNSKPAIVRFTGQLLDVRNGYVYFTTADAFKTSPVLRVVDFDTGGPTSLTPGPELYARATLEAASGSIVELALTRRKLPTDEASLQAYQQAHSYVITGSPKVVAPELLHGQRLTGRPVAVTFYVQVPPTTSLTDTVYITTDASGWVANAMRMDRIDALHYRLTRSFASGTKFAYRYTRGSWTSVEVGEDGLQDDPHQFFVPEVDAKRLTDVVYRWSDQNGTQQQAGPDAIPTPFNPNPFANLPSAIQHPGVPPPSPTPKP